MISVLIPAYRVERYIDRCIESVVQQTYHDLEIIVVWQPAEDKTETLLQAWVKRDPRVRIIKQEEPDLSTARNTLIAEAKGEYLIFVDGDDLIERDYIEILLLAMDETNADIAVSGCTAFHDADKICSTPFRHHYKIYNNTDYLNESMRGIHGTTSGVTQLKLYRRKVFDEVYFPNGRVCEDTATIYKTLWNAKTIVAVDYNGYYYQSNRTDSIMHSSRTRQRTVVDGLRARSEQIDFFRGKDEKLFALACVNVLTELMRIDANPDCSLSRENSYIEEVRNQRWKYLKVAVHGETPISKKLIAIGCVSCPRLMYRVWNCRRKLRYRLEWRNKG